MKKETQEYILGERNATRDEFILSREKVRGSEYISLSLPDKEEPIYKLWTRKKRTYKKPSQAVGEIEVKQPKHTGGKRPYIMLMQDQRDTINKLSNHAAGLMMKLLAGGFVEWDTGRLIDRRSKKPLTISMVRARYKLDTTKTKTLIKELTENKVIKYDRKQRSYFFNANFAKKGVGSSED